MTIVLVNKKKTRKVKNKGNSQVEKNALDINKFLGYGI